MGKKGSYTWVRYQRDLNLVRSVDEGDVNPDATFDSLDAKEQLLREYGFKSLKGAENLDEVSDAQLGVTFLRVYKTAIENISLYEEQRKDLEKRIMQRRSLEQSVAQPDLFSTDYYEQEAIADNRKRR